MLQVFDVLHLDGRSTRSFPYRERRALLAELALDGPAWRTPASLVVEDAHEFVSRVEQLGMEGVVAKRLGSTYVAGRRSTAWVKQKFRREEQLAVTGTRRSDDGRVEALFVARIRDDGSLAGAGSIELGLRGELVEALEQQLARLAARRRGALIWYPPIVSIVASCHGFPDGPVRDAVLCASCRVVPEASNLSLKSQCEPSALTSQSGMADPSRHERASETHREAAERHAQAASYWDAQGDDETAELERRNAKIERDAADLESDRAHLQRERQDP